MYNGIGLSTPRGSGTNGYVQRNFFFARPKTERQEYARPDQVKPLPAQKKANQEILEHQRKRQVEVQVFQWAEDNKFAEQGYSNLLSTYVINYEFIINFQQ